MARTHAPDAISPPPPQSPYFTVPQAAAHIGMDKTALYRAIRNGEIPVLRVGRAIRIPKQALDDLTRPATSTA